MGLTSERSLLFGLLTDWALVLGFQSDDDLVDWGACGAPVVQTCSYFGWLNFVRTLLCVDSVLDAIRPQVWDSGTEDLSVLGGDSTSGGAIVCATRGGGEEGTVAVPLQHFPMRPIRGIRTTI